MYIGTYIMVFGIPDYFLRLDSISDIIGPNNREILRYFVQIPKLLPKQLRTNNSTTRFTFGW